MPARASLALTARIKKLVAHRFVRFLFVGGINTLFGYGMFALFIFLGLHYAAATAVATVIAVLFNFFTTGTIVFKNADPRLIFRFVGVYCVGYLVNVGGLWVFNQFSVSNYIAGAILTLPMALLNFTLMKTLVFTRRAQGDEAREAKP